MSDVLDALRPRALESVSLLDPLQPMDVHRAARCFSASTAAGVDSWAPRSLVDLPGDAVLGHTYILNQCESLLAWPTQVYLNVIVLLPKNTEYDRPICKCPTFRWFYCQARNQDLDRWNHD
eukprot:3871125-Pyramimonas_sp.AAC.1